MKNERILWIREKVKEANADGVIVAISGGIDSAVVAHLAKESFPNNSLGIWLGIESSADAKRNALRVFEDTKIDMINLNLTDDVNLLFENIFNIYKKPESINEYENQLKNKTKINILNESKRNLIKGNLKARIRMLTIYAHAQNKNYLVLSTSNLSEITIGYYTKWGDGAGDIAPIADLTKSEVYELAKELGVNKNVISALPSADLWEGQNDEQEIGFSYNDLEKFIKGEKINFEIEKKILNLKNKSEHKRLGVINYKK